MADVTAALAHLDTAISEVEDALEDVSDVEAFAGAPGRGDGFFGPTLHLLRTLRGRVALNDEAVVFGRPE